METNGVKMNLFAVDSESIKLYNFQVNLEKSITPILERLKKYDELDLYELSIDLEKRRQNEWITLQTRIKDVVEPLKCKMMLIKNKQLGNITDFKQFKKEMVLIQENIQNLKYDSKKRMEQLDRDVMDLMDDIHFYKEKMLDWAEPVQINTYDSLHPKQKPNQIKSRHHCKEAKDFMDFVHLSGGHENGWRKEDHQLFIKFRKKFKNIDIIAKKLHEELPDISQEDIKCHEEWYQKYLHLEKRKRNALKEWQQEKSKKKKTGIYSNVPSKIATILQSSENTRKKLLKWKAQKEEQARTAREFEKYKRQKREEIEQLRKKRNEELKIMVQEWRERKQDSEEQETVGRKIVEEEEKKRRAFEANKLIKQFQSQDDMYISRMKEKRKPKIIPVIRSKSSQSAKRDPKRLLKPTQQWMNRVHDEDPTEQFGKVMALKCVPKLAIPEWRRKLD